ARRPRSRCAPRTKRNRSYGPSSLRRGLTFIVTSAAAGSPCLVEQPARHRPPIRLSAVVAERSDPPATPLRRGAPSPLADPLLDLGSPGIHLPGGKIGVSSFLTSSLRAKKN